MIAPSNLGWLKASLRGRWEGAHVLSRLGACCVRRASSLAASCFSRSGVMSLSGATTVGGGLEGGLLELERVWREVNRLACIRRLRSLVVRKSMMDVWMMSKRRAGRRSWSRFTERKT